MTTRTQVQAALTDIDALLDQLDFKTHELLLPHEELYPITNALFDLWEQIERAADKAHPYRKAA